MRDIIRQEFADRIVATEEQNKRLKIEMSELRARQAHELEQVRVQAQQVVRENETEMEEVHKR